MKIFGVHFAMMTGSLYYILIIQAFAQIFIFFQIFVSGLKRFLSVLDRDYISAQNFVNFGSASF